MSIDNHSHQDHDHFADEDTCWITSSLSVFDGVVKLALESSLEWNTWEDLKVDHPTQKTKQDNLLEVSRPLNQAHLFYMTMHDLRLHKITAYRSLIVILRWQKKGTPSPWGWSLWCDICGVGYLCDKRYFHDMYLISLWGDLCHRKSLQ